MEQVPAFTLSDVSKVYSNGTRALWNLNLTVGEGQFVSLVGPSGCGKSTVLKIIAGLGKMTSGSILWGKRSPRLAFVFQEAALMPWATVADNIRLPLKLAKVPKSMAEAIVTDVIDMVDLRSFERNYSRELSGGMKMRVSIARALATRPEMLLMDEPFGSLDEMTRSRLNSDLLNLWSQKQWTVVFVTHNIYEAVYLSNRVIVMAARPGRVVADIEIAAPYPRTEEFRLSPIYNDYCRHIFQALSQGTEPSSSLRSPSESAVLDIAN